MVQPSRLHILMNSVAANPRRLFPERERDPDVASLEIDEQHPLARPDPVRHGEDQRSATPVAGSHGQGGLVTKVSWRGEEPAAAALSNAGKALGGRSPRVIQFQRRQQVGILALEFPWRV